MDVSPTVLDLRDELRTAGPYSAASWRASPVIPALADAYAARPGSPKCACTEETITTAPLPDADRSDSSARVAR